jgi:hypothetical protein
VTGKKRYAIFPSRKLVLWECQDLIGIGTSNPTVEPINPTWPVRHLAADEAVHLDDPRVCRPFSSSARARYRCRSGLSD